MRRGPPGAFALAGRSPGARRAFASREGHAYAREPVHAGSFTHTRARADTGARLLGRVSVLASHTLAPAHPRARQGCA